MIIDAYFKPQSARQPLVAGILALLKGATSRRKRFAIDLPGPR
ncbi:hypothetical protein [Lolliginicoccus lacisalsi]|nr:hypothetical protein [Lolliginicoccus lacisalsi]